MYQAIKFIDRKPVQNLIVHDKLVETLQNLSQLTTSLETTSKHISTTRRNQS